MRKALPTCTLDIPWLCTLWREIFLWSLRCLRRWCLLNVASAGAALPPTPRSQEWHAAYEENILTRLIILKATLSLGLPPPPLRNYLNESGSDCSSKGSAAYYLSFSQYLASSLLRQGLDSEKWSIPNTCFYAFWHSLCDSTGTAILFVIL